MTMALVVEQVHNVAFEEGPKEAYEGLGDEESKAQAQLQRLEEEAVEIEKKTREVRAIVKRFEQQRQEQQQLKVVEEARAAAQKVEEARKRAHKAEEEQKLAEKLLEERRRAQKAKEERKVTEKARAAMLKMEEEQEQSMRERVARGRQLLAWADDADEIDALFTPEVTCIATGAMATLVLYEDPRRAWAYTRNQGLPQSLLSALHGRGRHLPPPSCAALGSQGRYYLRFADGTAQFVAPQAFGKALQSREDRDVRTVAFGEDWETFFVTFEDGSWATEGALPEGLSALLKTQTSLADVALGPCGEWFLRSSNHHCWWGGLGDEAQRFLASLRDRLVSVRFGEAHGFLCRYN